MPIVVLGNMRDLPGRRVEHDFAMSWAARERGKDKLKNGGKIKPPHFSEIIRSKRERPKFPG